MERATHALPSVLRILIVDDNSPDGTGDIAAELARQDARVEVLSRPVREGLGPAYVAGFQHALRGGAEVICQMDADLSHDPGALPALVEALAETDLVLGSRYVSGGAVEDWGLSRRLISRAGCWYAQRVLGMPIRDLTGGFKAFRRDVLEGLDVARTTAHGYTFQIEMTYRAQQAGFRIVEIPITFRDRQRGRSKMTFGIALEAAWRVPALRWRMRRHPGNRRS